MFNYLDKFCFDGQIAYVVRGMGLIGSEVSRAMSSMGAETLILDVKENEGKLLETELTREGFTGSYRDFDCSDLEQLNENFSVILDKFGWPDVFINCSYSRTVKIGETVHLQI